MKLVFVTSTTVVFTIHHHLCSNVWTMKASLSTRVCDITHTEGHSISSVTSAMSDYQSTATNFNGRHVPLSVSVASNVPGYEPAQCYVTDGDSDKLVADMMDHLTAISDAAYESLLPLYADVLEELKTRKEAWDEEEEEEEEEEDGKKTVNP